MPSQRQKDFKPLPPKAVKRGGMERGGRRERLPRAGAGGWGEPVGPGESLGFSCHLVASSALGHPAVPSGLVVVG